MVVKDEQGVHVQGVIESNAPFGKVYDPSHVYSKDDIYYCLILKQMMKWLIYPIQI